MTPCSHAWPWNGFVKQLRDRAPITSAIIERCEGTLDEARSVLIVTGSKDDIAMLEGPKFRARVEDALKRNLEDYTLELRVRGELQL